MFAAAAADEHICQRGQVFVFDCLILAVEAKGF